MDQLKNISKWIRAEIEYIRPLNMALVAILLGLGVYGSLLLYNNIALLLGGVTPTPTEVVNKTTIPEITKTNTPDVVTEITPSPSATRTSTPFEPEPTPTTQTPASPTVEITPMTTQETATSTPTPTPPETPAIIVRQPQLSTFFCDGSTTGFSPSDTILFEWTWSGKLYNGEYLEVRIGPRGASLLTSQGQGIFDSDNNKWFLPVEATRFFTPDAHDYHWQVVYMAADKRSELSLSDRGCINVK